MTVDRVVQRDEPTEEGLGKWKSRADYYKALYKFIGQAMEKLPKRSWMKGRVEMDKEAQGKIIIFLDTAYDCGKRNIPIDVEGNSLLLLNHLGNLGYRKLPRGKPPLIEGSNDAIRFEWLNPESMFYVKRIARAQREADIKFYS